MVNLSLTEKGGSTNELSFDKDEVTIGRVRGNDIVLPKGNVSKHHCRLVVRGGGVLTEDLRSTNGTYVNGRKITEPTPIVASDKVFVGDFIIRVISAETSLDGLQQAPAPPGPPEAGSLSSALPRRPPPPPPGSRSSGMDEGSGSAPKPGLRSPLPPPPPPPPFPIKRDNKLVPMTSDGFPPPSGPSDINLDDEDDDLDLAHPKLNVPPLKPAVQPAVGQPSETETLHGAAASGLPDFGGDDAGPVAPPDADREDSIDPPFGTAGGSSEATVVPSQRAQPANEAAASAKAPAKAQAKRTARPVDVEVPEWLSHLLEGDGVTAVFTSGPNQAEVLRYGNRETVSVPQADLAALGGVIRKLVTKGSPKPASDAAAISTTLPDGMHIAALYPPVADRLCTAVRRPVAAGKSLDDLVEDQVISAGMHQVLDACVSTRQNILLSGDRAACDSLLRAILWSVDRVARVALISDVIVPPASATSWIRLGGEQPSPDLINAAVAMQPEYLIVDSNHSALSGDVLNECSLGLTGAVLSVVARSTSDALHRLALLGGALGPADQLGERVAESIDVVVQASVLPDGTFKVVEIAEPKASLDGQISAHALLTWTPGDGSSGAFTTTGAHSLLAGKLATAGNEIPGHILNRQ